MSAPEQPPTLFVGMAVTVVNVTGDILCFDMVTRAGARPATASGWEWTPKGDRWRQYGVRMRSMTAGIMYLRPSRPSDRKRKQMQEATTAAESWGERAAVWAKAAEHESRRSQEAAACERIEREKAKTLSAEIAELELTGERTAGSE